LQTFTSIIGAPMHPVLGADTNAFERTGRVRERFVAKGFVPDHAG